VDARLSCNKLATNLSSADLSKQNNSEVGRLAYMHVQVEQADVIAETMCMLLGSGSEYERVRRCSILLAHVAF